MLTLYADGVEIGSAGVNSDEPFRLPSGYRGRQFEIEIETYTDVNQITIASSIQDSQISDAFSKAAYAKLSA